MKYIKILILTLFSALPLSNVLACEPMQSADFYLGRDVELVDSNSERIQVPKFKFVDWTIYRGSNGDGWSCKDIGSAWLEFSFPDDLNLNFEDSGISLKVKRVFSSENVIGPIDRIISPVKIEDNKAQYLIIWYDGRENWSKEINIMLEARVVLKNGKVGAPIEFRLNG